LVLCCPACLQIGSTILAQAAGVPTLPWSGSGVAVSFAECNGVIPEDTYNKACVFSLDEAIESCQRIGYPIMLKASWGGGGKGIRKVHNDDEVRQVFKQIQGEVSIILVFSNTQETAYSVVAVMHTKA
jgi:acetyl-CoA carboxylase/biotin carboxylase 1